MSRFHAVTHALVASGLLVGGLALTAGPAQATDVKCGATITTNTTLHSDVGPCRKDGLTVAASGITLDLNGYSVFGSNKNAEQVGIRLAGVSGVTLTSGALGGTVRNFDAGVVVEGGSGNSVTNLTVRDNINDLKGPTCELGDGILTVDSDDNLVDGNDVVNNGPYSGIALVGDSDDNTVSNNAASSNNVVNIRSVNGKVGRCGAPFSRPVQDIGIRVEGPGANGNVVDANTVTNSAIVGISVHGYVCAPPDGSTPDDPNTGNTISGNTVTDTGLTTFAQDTLADGIAILAQGPAAVVCTSFDNTITGNTVYDNFRDGIGLNRGTSLNEVSDNLVYDNGRDGIRLNAGITSADVVYPGAEDNTVSGNTGFGTGWNTFFTDLAFDGHDLNPDCDANVWSLNAFDTFDPPCAGA